MVRISGRRVIVGDRFAAARLALTASARQARAEDDHDRRLPMVGERRRATGRLSLVPSRRRLRSV